MSEEIYLPSGLAADAVAVTPSDSTTYSPLLCGLYIGGAGNVVVKGRSGVAVTFTNVPAGTILPIVVSAVMATNTTATSITGFIN